MGSEMCIRDRHTPTHTYLYIHTHSQTHTLSRQLKSQPHTKISQRKWQREREREMDTYKLGISSQARSPHPLPGPQLKGSVLAYCFCQQVPLCQLPVSFTLKIQHTQGHLQHFRPLGYSTVAPSSYTLTVIVSTKWGTHFIHTHCHCVKVGHPFHTHSLSLCQQSEAPILYFFKSLSTEYGTHFIQTVNKVCP